MPIRIARFFPKDSTNAAVKKNATVTCPKYQTEPTEAKYQTMLPNPTKSPDQTASSLSFLILYDRAIVKTTRPAPKICARNCCSKLFPKTKTKGSAKIAGIGGWIT